MVTLATAAAQPTAVVGNDQFFPKFVLLDVGVLYENPVMQIGVKSEFHSRIGAGLALAHHPLMPLPGRVSLFYGNRGSAPLTNVVTRIVHSQHPNALVFKTQPISTTIAPGAQEPQVINVECNQSFSSPPILEVDLKCVDASLWRSPHCAAASRAAPSALHSSCQSRSTRCDSVC